MVQAGKKKDGFKQKEIGSTSKDWQMSIPVYVLS